MMPVIPSQYRNQKTILISAAVLCSVIACGILLVSTYTTMQQKLEDQEQLLFVSQKNVRKLNGLRQEVRQQQQQLTILGTALLKGNTKDAVKSTMQIQIQSMLNVSGLDPESLRPMASRETGGSTIQSVVLKLRLGGSIEQFKTFLATLYAAESFFHIEGLTVKAFKQDQLKIYMDLRGYYHTSALPQTAKKGRQ